MKGIFKRLFVPSTTTQIELQDDVARHANLLVLGAASALAFILLSIPFVFLIHSKKLGISLVLACVAVSAMCGWFLERGLVSRGSERADAARHESENRYRDLVEHSHDLICTHDLQGRLLSINAHPARILGYSPEEMLNKPMRDFLPAEARSDFDDYLRRVQRDGSAEGTLVVLTKAGDRRMWEYRNTLRTEVVSTPIVRGMAHDITERWQAEKALRLSEEKFSKAFACSPGLLSISTLKEGRFIAVNDTFEKQCGYRRQELIGHTSIELGLWCDSADRDALVSEISRAHSVRNREITFRAKTGQPIVILLSGEILELAGERCLLWVGKDITDQKKVEDALKQSVAEYRSLFLAAPCGICRISLAGDVLVANDALVKMLGYESAQELSAKNIDRDIQDMQSDQLRGTDRADGQLGAVEARWKKKDGSSILVRTNSQAIRNEVGETLCLETTVEDITHQRSLEEHLQQSQKMEAIGRFASGVAHDFNNILTGILAYAQMLSKSKEFSERDIARSQQIVEACMRARDLTGNLLGFSRDESLPVHLVCVDDEVAQMEDMLIRVIGERINVRVSLHGGSAAVLAGRNTITQMILNLASNARDAMPEGGVFTVLTSLAEIKAKKKLEVGIPDGKYAVIRVSDTGCGMNRATKDRIFEAFFTTKSYGKGTGLGLYTVYAMVRQCSGHIRVNSKPGRGSEFIIYLPLANSARPKSEPKSMSVPFQPNRELIMIVEDNAVARASLRDQLLDSGYLVICEANGSEAIRDFEKRGGDIRLILTDVIMPGMNGVELVKRLKEKRRDLRAVFMTGWAPEGIVAAEVIADGSALLRKPFTTEELTSSIGRVLSA